MMLKSPFLFGCAFAGLAAQSFAAPDPGTNRNHPRDFSAFQMIAERNIFDPNRRPSVRSQSQAQPTIVNSFTFTGFMAYGGKGPFAVFDGTSADYRRVLQKNDKIAGYTVADIKPDAVQLVLGTNEVVLKLGMQMRRSEDGQWFKAEASDFAGAGYAATSLSRYPDRNDRRSERRRNSGDASGADSALPASPEPPGPPESTGALPSAGANGDSNDPVTRMMLRRLQETGGGGTNSSVSPDSGSNLNGGPNGSSGPDQPAPVPNPQSGNPPPNENNK